MKPKFKVGDVVVVDYSIDKLNALIIEELGNNWFKVLDLSDGNYENNYSEVRQDWLMTFEEFEEWRNRMVDKNSDKG
jgi:hypothetical protein